MRRVLEIVGYIGITATILLGVVNPLMAPVYTYVRKEVANNWSALQTFTAGFDRPTVKTVEICPSGCKYTTLNAACAANISTASDPIRFYIHAGTYAAADTMCNGQDHASFVGDGIGVTTITGIDHGFGVNNTSSNCASFPLACKAAINLFDSTNIEITNMTLKGSRGIFSSNPSGVGGGDLRFHDLEIITTSTNGDEDCWLLRAVQDNTIIRQERSRCSTNADGFTFGANTGTGTRIYADGNTCDKAAGGTQSVNCWNLSSIPERFQADGEKINISGSQGSSTNYTGYRFVGTLPGGGTAVINSATIFTANTTGNGNGGQASGVVVESGATELTALDINGSYINTDVPSDTSAGSSVGVWMQNQSTTLITVNGGSLISSGGQSSTRSCYSIPSANGSAVSMSTFCSTTLDNDLAIKQGTGINLPINSLVTLTSSGAGNLLKLDNTTGAGGTALPTIKICDAQGTEQCWDIGSIASGSGILGITDTTGTSQVALEIHPNLSKIVSNAGLQVVGPGGQTYVYIGDGSGNNTSYLGFNATNPAFMQWNSTNKRWEWLGVDLIQFTNVSSNPTVGTNGDFAMDTTANQIVYQSGSSTRVLDPVHDFCYTQRGLATTDDNFIFFMANQAMTVTGVGCRCVGTCGTNPTFALEDNDGNAMTHATPTCSTTTTEAAYTAVTANNSLVAGEGVAFDTGVATGTAGDWVTICITYTVDRQ